MFSQGEILNQIYHERIKTMKKIIIISLLVAFVGSPLVFAKQITFENITFHPVKVQLNINAVGAVVETDKGISLDNDLENKAGTTVFSVEPGTKFLIVPTSSNKIEGSVSVLDESGETIGCAGISSTGEILGVPYFLLKTVFIGNTNVRVGNMGEAVFKNLSEHNEHYMAQVNEKGLLVESGSTVINSDLANKGGEATFEATSGQAFTFVPTSNDSLNAGLVVLDSAGKSIGEIGLSTNPEANSSPVFSMSVAYASSIRIKVTE